jgi:hypothetical protein
MKGCHILGVDRDRGQGPWRRGFGLKFRHTFHFEIKIEARDSFGIDFW